MSGKARRELMESKRECEHAAYVLEGAYRTLASLPNGEDKEHLISMLRMYVINNNCSLIVTPESPISAEHKLLIRDDCNGLIKGTGGHLSELMQLKSMFSKYDYHIITEKTKSNMHLKEKHTKRVYQALGMQVLYSSCLFFS